MVDTDMLLPMPTTERGPLMPSPRLMLMPTTMELTVLAMAMVPMVLAMAMVDTDMLLPMPTTERGPLMPSPRLMPMPTTMELTVLAMAMELTVLAMVDSMWICLWCLPLCPWCLCLRQVRCQ